MTTSHGTSVDADNIVFSYGVHRVIKGLYPSVSAGEVFGMLGAFGASLLAAVVTLRRA